MLFIYGVSPQFHTPQYRQLYELLLLLLLLLLRWAPWALDGGPSDRQHLLGVGREDSEWAHRPTQGVLPEDCAASGRVFAAPPCTAGTYALKKRCVSCS